MKNLYDLLSQKEDHLRQLQAQVEALQIALRIIEEQPRPAEDSLPPVSGNPDSVLPPASKALRLASYISKSISFD
jgi:hypothetical protein